MTVQHCSGTVLRVLATSQRSAVQRSCRTIDLQMPNCSRQQFPRSLQLQHLAGRNHTFHSLFQQFEWPQAAQICKWVLQVLQQQGFVLRMRLRELFQASLPQLACGEHVHPLTAHH